jgi:hypothetical protein
MNSIIEGIVNSTSKNDDSNDDDSPTFNDYVTGQLFRIGITYAAFIIIALMLVNSQIDPTKRYSHIWIITGVYIIITFVIEMIWLFYFIEDNRGKNKDAVNNVILDKILNDILPFTALVFGYVILIDAFRQNMNVNNVEYILRTISVLIFIGCYGYLFVNLVTNLTGDKNGSSIKKTLSDTYTDQNTEYTYYDSLIDTIYNLFQPISIISVAIILFYIVRLTFSSGGSVANAPSPPPVMNSSPQVNMDQAPPSPQPPQ